MVDRILGSVGIAPRMNTRERDDCVFLCEREREGEGERERRKDWNEDGVRVMQEGTDEDSCLREREKSGPGEIDVSRMKKKNR